MAALRALLGTVVGAAAFTLLLACANLALLLLSRAARAVLLPALGLHGVIAHGVAQRTREIGIRAAAGVHPTVALRAD